MSTFVKGGGGAGEKVKIDGVKVANKMELTSYKGANPLTIGQAGVAFPANTLFLEDFDILNGVNGEDLTDTAADQTTAVTELMKMVNRKIAMNNGEGQYVWKKLTAEGGDFIDFVVSADTGAYPNGGTQDGYWYEMIDNYTGANPLTIGESGTTIPANTLLEEALQILNGVEAGIPIPNGFTKYAVNKIVMSSRKSADSGITHSLGTVPRLALITRSTSGTMSANDLLYGFTARMMDNVTNNKSYFCSAKNATNGTETTTGMQLSYTSYVTSTQLKCWDGYLTAGVEYTLITMA